MIYKKEVAEIISLNLLEIKAIKLNNTNPFTWASGLKSPIYCDNRVALSYPEKRSYIKIQLANAIRDHFRDVDVIAGVATAGIPQGALVADILELPFVYIRSSTKAHGMTNKIEGKIEKGQTVVVVEDLISTGKSSLNAVDALTDSGAVVVGMVAIFTYGLKIAEENFTNKDCKLIALADYNAMINMAVRENYVSNEDELSLLEWRKDPKKWSDNNSE